MNINELERVVDELGTQARDAQVRHAVAAELGTRSNFRTLLKSAACDMEWLRWATESAYYHPANGFQKIVLCGSDKRRCEVRLHIYWRDTGQATHKEPHIHNHPWDFSSTIVCGSLRTLLFEESGDGQRYDAYKAAPPGDGGEGYTFIYDREAFLRPVLDTTCHAICTYSIDHRLTHQVHGDDSRTTATLMVQGPFLREVTDIYTNDPLATGTRRVSGLSEVEIRDSIERLLRVVQ